MTHPSWADRPARPSAPMYSLRAWIAYLAALGLTDDEIALVLGLTEGEARALRVRTTDAGRRR